MINLVTCPLTRTQGVGPQKSVLFKLSTLLAHVQQIYKIFFIKTAFERKNDHVRIPKVQGKECHDWNKDFLK